MQKAADTSLIAAVVVLVLSGVTGVFVDLNTLVGLSKEVFVVLLGCATIVYLIATLYCLGLALDLPKSAAKYLWIAGILVGTAVVVPIFYFSRGRLQKTIGEQSASPKDSHADSGRNQGMP